MSDDPEIGPSVTAAVALYDRHYGAPGGFLGAMLDDLRSAGDVRGRTLVWFFSRRLDLVTGKRVLHIAPEPALRAFFETGRSEFRCTYETLDGFDMSTTHQADLTRLPLAAGTFDLVICHRVLEHVMDDRTAIAEMYRVLSIGGTLDVSVPQSMNRPDTDEWLAGDASHHMHVRQYGRDFEERLREAGFCVTVDRTLLERALGDHLADATYPMRHYLCLKTESGGAERAAVRP